MESSSNTPRDPTTARDRASDRRFGRWFDGPAERDGNGWPFVEFKFEAPSAEKDVDPDPDEWAERIERDTGCGPVAEARIAKALRAALDLHRPPSFYVSEETRDFLAAARRAERRTVAFLLFAVALYLVTLAALALGFGRLIWGSP